MPLYQLLGTNLRSSVGTGLAGETLGKGGRVAAEAWNAASFFSKPESSQGEGRKKKTTGKKKFI